MKLTELLQIQKDLNAKIGSSPKSREDICMAIVEECGELSRALRPQWRWWNWKNKTDSINRDEPLTELVDILHFLLTAIDAENIEGDNWSWERDVLDAYWDDWEGLSFTVEDEGWTKNLVKLQVCVLEGRIGVAVLHYVKACFSLGFDRERVEEAFLEKAQVNRDRMSSVNQH